ncbi:MAG TPA: S-adenosylmethionine decarboxylase [Alphaproteobacteria bacterium]|nr:S-adenosylmethionine decarboxylase [Alphaproteobacteria bacterium]
MEDVNLLARADIGRSSLRSAVADRKVTSKGRETRQDGPGADAGRSRARLVLDLWDARSLDDWMAVQATLVEGAVAAGARDLDLRMRQHAASGGVFGLVYMRGSRIRALTWPRHGLATIDLLTHDPLDPLRAVSVIFSRLAPRRITLRAIRCNPIVL